MTSFLGDLNVPCSVHSNLSQQFPQSSRGVALLPSMTSIISPALVIPQHSLMGDPQA